MKFKPLENLYAYSMYIFHIYSTFTFTVHLANEPANTKPYKIKAFWTHVLYVTIAIKRNTNGVVSKIRALLFKEQNRYYKYVSIKHVSMN